MAPDKAPDAAHAVVLAPEREFEVVFRRLNRQLFSLAFSILRDRGEAEDAVQDTMTQAWRSWPALRQPDKRDAWVRQICVRQCFRRRTRLARAPLASSLDDTELLASDHVPGATRFASPALATDDPMGPGRDAGRIGLSASADPALDRAFRLLPVKQRAAVVLHYHFGYTVEQCAELMGCGPGTVRTHVHRALGRLRQELDDA